MLLAALLAAVQGAAPTPEAHRELGWDDFPVFVWREQYAGKPLPAELVEPFGGVILMREEDSSWARERGLAYLVWNVAGRDALHLDADEAWNERVEAWIRTQDEKLLVREPCLNDPQTVAKLFETLDATIAKHGEHPGLGFVLGDEVSLTPNGDPFDLCRCGFCEAAWKDHARKHGLPERAPLTDEVRRALLDDDFTTLGAWMARRRFDQTRLLGLLEPLAAHARGNRERLVGLLGVKGRTPFGGVDVFAAARFIDTLEGYAVGETLAMLSSTPRFPSYLDPPRARWPAHDSTLSTLFLEGESPAGAAWLAWESWMRGADGLVLWSDRDLAATGLRERLAGAVQAIRGVGERFPERGQPILSRAALVTDGDSISVSWLREALLDGPTWPRRKHGHSDEHGPRGQAIRAWMRAADEYGRPLGCTSFGELAGGFSVLVLPEVAVLDEADVRELEAFLDRGGTLVVDGCLGWVDRQGRPWPESVEERLRRRSPERVVVAPPHEQENFSRTIRPLLAPGDGLLSLDGTGLDAGWRSAVRSAKPLGCFLDSSQLEFCVTLLPAADSAAQRAAIPALRLEPNSAHEFERIFPPEGEALAPGDAAVFLVRVSSPGRAR